MWFGLASWVALKELQAHAVCQVPGGCFKPIPTLSLPSPKDTQYAFRAACGKFLSVSDRAPFVTLARWVPGGRKGRQGNHRLPLKGIIGFL